MGQQVVALMFGISSKTKGLVTKDGEYFWDDYSEGAPKAKRYPDSKAPQVAYDGGVFGFAVAAGPALNSNEGYLGATTPLADLEAKHAKRIEQAKAKWAAFAAWAKQVHGKSLPEAQLWITTDERA